MVDITDTLSFFSSSVTEAVKAYKAYVREGMGEKETLFKDMEAGIILGSKRFKAKVLKFLGKIKAHEELPQVKRLSEPKRAQSWKRWIQTRRA